MAVAAPALPVAPGPRTWLPGGSFWEFRNNRLGFVTEMARTYGDIVGVSFARQRVFLVSKPEWIEDVLVVSAKKFAKGIALERARRLLGRGLLTNEGADHLKQRRTIQPLFHRQHVQGFAEAMVRHATRWAGSVQDGARLNVTSDMSALTLAIVGETLFSSNVQGQADEVRAALTDVVAGFDLLFVPMIGTLEQLPLPVFIRMKRARERLDRIIRTIIKERRAEEAEASSLHAHDLVSMLVAARDPENPTASGMSDEQIRDEAMTIFLAGHETTANAMAWTWHLLGSAPNAERRLHEELDHVLGGRTPAAEDVPKLEWTRAIVSESMRLFPPAWTIGRRAIERHVIGGYAVERGDLVLVSQYVAHRDPRWWESPESFKPERWTGTPAPRPKFAYFPFGGGTRICIGESFAWTELILLLATIAQRIRLVPTDDPPPVPEPKITLRPHGLFMRAVLRGATRAADAYRA
ncbi:MAG: cytochrome P450 [Vicinamibacterales bacterium]